MEGIQVNFDILLFPDIIFYHIIIHVHTLLGITNMNDTPFPDHYPS